MMARTERPPWKASTPRSIVRRAYVEAGADMIFPEAMNTLDDYRRFKAAVKVPILANLTEFGSTPFFTADEFATPASISLCTARRVSRDEQGGAEFLRDRAPRRHQKNIIDTLQTRAELYDYLGYHAYEDKLDALFAQEK